ncbi:DUF6119 family protein [Pseudonocardia alni]|uniref:DUF6119 family protein n=1 Tax=Pseudonocardia alni TaxID=33907 RepID=UPI00332B8502
MAPRSSPATRTTVYRLDDVAELALAIRDKYRDSDAFTTRATTVDGREALLVSGAMLTERVSWASTVRALTSLDVTLGNTTSAAVLLIRRGEDGAWALSYGMGFQLLDQSVVDSAFGQRIAVRVADPASLSSLTRTTLDQRARTDRLSIPGGDHLRGFGAGDFGELVTRLVAEAEIPALTAGEQPIRIRGAAALSVPLGKRPDRLVVDLDRLDEILDLPADPQLAMLEQLVAIKNAPELVDELEQALDAALDAPASARLGLSWPHERIDENGTPSSFRITGLRRRRPPAQDGVPDLAAVLAAVGEGDRPLSRLRKLQIQLFGDPAGDDAVSPVIPGDRWVSFEVDRDGKRYCFHDGRWYLMDERYAEKLRRQVTAIFAGASPVALPDWPAGHDEKDYNELAAREIGGVCLDRRLIRTDTHPRGIEACDVLDRSGTLVHVKNLDGSAAGSHLIGQALVSADALLYDEQARAALRARVIERGGDPDHLPDRVHTVVLGLARTGKKVTADSLFTFTQVTLARGVNQLEGRGVRVLIAPIDRRTATDAQ